MEQNGARSFGRAASSSAQARKYRFARSGETGEPCEVPHQLSLISVVRFTEQIDRTESRNQPSQPRLSTTWFQTLAPAQLLI